jgi:sugar/nucleoside kinase (ribokinase family)
LPVRFDYTAVGHVTLDVMADGSRRPGGGAFYSALQAARLGLRTRILTRGVREEIEALLEPYLEELSLDVLEAAHTTTLETIGQGRERSQRVLAWAGEIGAEPRLDTEILHLAPVARETSGRTGAGTDAAFVGVTPQGLVRDWSEAGGRIVTCALDRSLLPEHCDALVLSEAERDSCAVLLGGTGGRYAGERMASADAPVIAVTHGEAPTELRLPGGVEIHVEVPAVQRMCDDIGAGDVFAAAFFIALAGGEDPRTAAQFANAAAAVRVSAQGAGAIGDRAAIEARWTGIVRGDDDRVRKRNEPAV